MSAVVNPVAYQLELPVHWRCHNVFHVSLLKPFRSNGEAVPPQSFTLTGGDEHVFEAEFIYDFGPKTLHQNGKARKINELNFFVKWRGVKQGIDAKQPYQNVQRSAQQLLKDCAVRWKLPADTFLKGGNRLPDSWVSPDTHLPGPPVRLNALILADILE